MRSAAIVTAALSILPSCNAYDWILTGPMEERLDRVPDCYWPCIPEGVKAMKCDAGKSVLACLSGPGYVVHYDAATCEKKHCSAEDTGTWYYAVVDIRDKYNARDATDEDRSNWSKMFDERISGHKDAASTAGKQDDAKGSSGSGSGSPKKSGTGKTASSSFALLAGVASAAFMALQS
ncbi:hypothetical protein NLG97_g526 [Lecanicillium saksenae]|uniref:Uncharacterized protein n=1 Tax=Lecanicillium saksenae TaxID=468837 RepID=A0ACC1R899_9HYPO|nr:hypothetical protein NLG97_g526 [Lecanicillium saksenae]